MLSLILGPFLSIDFQKYKFDALFFKAHGENDEEVGDQKCEGEIKGEKNALKGTRV